MTVQQVIYALRLAKHRNFRSAAASLGISQPGLSLQIKKLEQDLDMVLFDRSTKKVQPTDKGQIFLEKAQMLANESLQLRQLVQRLQEDNVGTLRVGIIPTLSSYLLPLFIDDLLAKYPDLDLSIVELMTEDVISQIKQGSIDGGIISTPIKSTLKMAIKTLFYEEIMAFVSPDHNFFIKSKIDPSLILPKDLWLLTEGNCFRDQVDQLCPWRDSNSKSRRFSYASNSIEGLCRIVEAQGGLTFIPALATIHLEDQRADMVKPLTTRHVREVSIVHLPQHVRHQELQVLGDTITQHIPTRMLDHDEAYVVSTKVDI